MAISNDFYYCLAWPHEKRTRDNAVYEIGISDAIPGNIEKTLWQFHIVITKDGVAVKLNELCPVCNPDRLKLLEDTLVSIINRYCEQKHSLDGGNVRIWYIPPEGHIFDERDLFLRLAITVANVEPILTQCEEGIKSDLKNAIWKWIEECIDDHQETGNNPPA